MALSNKEKLIVKVWKLSKPKLEKKMSNLKELTTEKLYTKEGCNLVFSIKEGATTKGLKEVDHNDIYSVLRNEKGRTWVSKQKKWYLDTDGVEYTDNRINREIVQKGFEQS